MMNKLNDLTKYPQTHPKSAQKSENQKLSDQELDAVKGSRLVLHKHTKGKAPA